MLTRILEGVLCSILTVCVVGCASQTTDDGTDGSNALSGTEAPAASPQASFVGKWELQSTNPSAPSATIDIRTVAGADIKFDLSAMVLSVGHVVDEELVGEHAAIEGSVATYKRGDCTIKMTLDPQKPSTIAVNQSGSCTDGVDVTGRYARSNQ